MEGLELRFGSLDRHRERVAWQIEQVLELLGIDMSGIIRKFRQGQLSAGPGGMVGGRPQ